MKKNLRLLIISFISALAITGMSFFISKTTIIQDAENSSNIYFKPRCICANFPCVECSTSVKTANIERGLPFPYQEAIDEVPHDSISPDVQSNFSSVHFIGDVVFWSITIFLTTNLIFFINKKVKEE